MKTYQRDKDTLRSETQQEGYKKCERDSCSLWFKAPSRAVTPRKVTRSFCSNECLAIHREECRLAYEATRSEEVHPTRILVDWGTTANSAADLFRSWQLGTDKIILPLM